MGFGGIITEGFLFISSNSMYGIVELFCLFAICKRLFANRKRQQWPSRIVKGERWDDIYQEGTVSVKGLLPTVDEAIEWANDLIKRIEG
jgi:hypothetical protein